MKSLKWEGIGMKNLFPHTSSSLAFTRAPSRTRSQKAAQLLQVLQTIREKHKQEAQLSPRDRAMCRVS